MIDLTDKLTVFVITCGNNPNYDACLQALNNQSCAFKLDIVKNYSPMSLAFQQMLNRCNTKYFIQIDEDMILNKNAIEHMYKFFEGNQSPDNIVMDCYLLHDVHLSKDIYGVKIYNYDIFKNYEYNLNHPSAEVEQLSRLKADGYDIRFKNEVMGEHSPHWTNESVFERYYNLAMKFRLYRYSWMEKLPKILMDKIKTDPSDKNILAYSGALAGIFAEKTMNEEKDFSKKRKEYGTLQAFIEQPHQATLYVGDTCNFKCAFCFRQHAELEHAPDMTPEIAGTVVKKFPKIKGICICGFREPLTSKNLIPILRVLKSANKYVGVITNGSLLTKRFNEIKGWFQPDYISVSLNASNKERHEAITHTKLWDTVIEGIKLVQQSDIDCYVSSVVTLENINDVKNVIKLVHSLGVTTLHLHNLLPHFSENSDDTYFWNNVLQTQHKHLIDEIKKLPEASIVKAWPVLIDKSGGKNVCSFPWYSFSVNGNGNLSFCNSVLPANKKYGNINDFVVFNSQQAQEFRNKFCSGDLPHCKKCFRNWYMNF